MISLRIFRSQSKCAVYVSGFLATCLCFTYIFLRCNIILDKASNSFTLCGFNTDKIRTIFDVNASRDISSQNSSKNAEETTQFNPSIENPVAHCPKPVKHVVFLKVHKAGSSTLLNVVYRYGLKHKLIFALPKGSNYFNHASKDFNSSRAIPIPNGFQFEVLCNHAVYNRTTFRPLFPNDTFYFSILRQPFMQFVSASRYYGLIGQKRLQVEKPYQTFLLNRSKFTFPPGYNFYDNRMSYDLGLEPKYFHDPNKIREFIEMLDKDFQLMLIAEYFDESLVLLRRYLCWTMKDILSFRMNVNHNHYNYTFSVQDFLLHRKQTTADYMLYDYYIKIFWERVALEGSSFFNELSIFKKVQNLMSDFCLHYGAKTNLTVSASQWNKEFQITRRDCSLLMKKELPFLDLIREEQRRRFYKINLLANVKREKPQTTPIVL